MIEAIARYAGYVSSILALLLIVIKPVREWLFGISAVRTGQLCLLRSQILGTYYRHESENEPTLRQYERENLDALYCAYNAEHGNTFVKDIYETMRTWKVVT